MVSFCLAIARSMEMQFNTEPGQTKFETHKKKNFTHFHKKHCKQLKTSPHKLLITLQLLHQNLMESTRLIIYVLLDGITKVSNSLTNLSMREGGSAHQNFLCTSTYPATTICSLQRNVLQNEIKICMGTQKICPKNTVRLTTTKSL